MKKFNKFFCRVTIVLAGFIASTYAGSFYCPLTVEYTAGETVPSITRLTYPKSFTFHFSGKIEWYGHIYSRPNSIVCYYTGRYEISKNKYSNEIRYDIILRGFEHQPSGGNWVAVPGMNFYRICETEGDINNCLMDKYDPNTGG